MNFKTLAILLSVLFATCTKEKEVIHIYTIGDSTMANKKVEVAPETGWGMVFDQYFNDCVVVHNHAVNGRSTKSFIDEGRWQAVLDSLKKGDYVFIQFGHNDQKFKDSTRFTTPFGTYAENLTKYVKESRDKGAIPVLLTSIVRRKFDENGKLIDTHQDYPVAMRKVAEQLDVPLIDLQKLTEKVIQDMGDEASKTIYLWTEPDDRFPEGRQDDTHLCVEGAHLVSRLVADDIKNQSLELSSHLK